VRASVDIGTNTVRMLVASSKTLIPKKKISKIGRLGEASNKHITEKAMKRVISILKDYSAICLNQYNIAPEKIKAVATSAAREADNSGKFIDEVYKSTGIKVKIIDGTTEGSLTAAGALKNLKVKYPSLVVDIGGGSTEIIEVTEQNSKVNSIEIGALKCKERFLSDPPKEKQIVQAKQWIKSEIEKLNIDKPETLVATAGTPTSAAAILLGLDRYDSEKIHGYKTNLNNLESLLGELKKIPSVDILDKYKVIQKGREDLLVSGLLILTEIMKLWNDELIVSDQGLLEGILLKDF